ncbi:MAG: helix-hairpin-helix domain-containing protein [Actinobacteria bacterium]|nr:helix-hairpin-helix domain-containing protein [Actinomycetota bacterium]
MKDPLQAEETPYEVLGVGEEATDGDIDQAFRTALAGGDAQRVTRAWQTLKRPQDRTFLDLLRYDPETLRTLAPSPLDDPAVLEPPARAATAARWEGQLAERYPDPGAAHALAVLWHWWAIQAGGTTGPAGSSWSEGEDRPLDAADMWERAVAYWATVIASDGFWVERVDPSLAADLAQRIERTLRERFDSLAAHHRQHGNAEEGERYRALDLALSTELRTARALSRTGIGTDHGPVCSGSLLLGRLGLREGVARLIDQAIEASPGDAELRSLRDALSPYARISALIHEGRAREAVAELAKLPRPLRRTGEVAALEARALVALGEQEAELGRVDDAIERWAKVLATASDEGTRAAAHAAVVAATRERAAALSGERPDEAIALLERGESLTQDPTLRSTLAELLAQRGIGTINRTQDEVGPQGLTPALKRRFDAGRKDLERAARLGSVTAAGQLEVAGEFLERLRVGDVVEEAGRAAERGDWETAVARLRSAVETLGEDVPETLRRNLAVALANRANERSGQAIELVNSAGQAASALRPDRSGMRLSVALSMVKAGHAGEVKARKRRERWSPKRLMRSALLLALLGLIWWGFYAYAGRWEDWKAWTWPSSPTLRRAGAATGTMLTAAVFIWFIWAILLGPFFAWVKRTWADIPKFMPASGGRGPSGPPCDVCGREAAYRIQTDGSGEGTPLCSTHAHELESAVERAATVSLPQPVLRQVDAMFDSAEQDLQEAAALAPDLEGVGESARQLAEARTRIGLPPSSATGALAGLAGGGKAKPTPRPAPGRKRGRDERRKDLTRGLQGPSPPTRERKPTPPPRAPAARPGSHPSAGVGPRVDINRASEQELAALPGIGAALARRIVAYRDANGPFFLVDHLKRVDGVGEATFENVRSLVAVRRVLP